MTKHFTEDWSADALSGVYDPEPSSRPSEDQDLPKESSLITLRELEACALNWLEPVRSRGELPTETSNGSSIFVEDESAIFIFHDGTWVRLASPR